MQKHFPRLPGAILLIGVTKASAASCGESEQASITIDEAREIIVRGDLGDAALAETGFFSANGFYTTETSDLEQFGYEPDDLVTVVAVTADSASY